MLENSGVPRLAVRREEMFRKFSVKASNNPKICEYWFPKNDCKSHNTRNCLTYQEVKPKTERLKNSPVFKMRKVLNELANT